MRRVQLAAVLTLALAAPALSESPPVEWQIQSSGVEASLRGLSAISEKVAWASGANGTWLRTVDGGVTWQHGRIAGAEELGVRDIHAFDDHRFPRPHLSHRGWRGEMGDGLRGQPAGCFLQLHGLRGRRPWLCGR